MHQELFDQLGHEHRAILDILHRLEQLPPEPPEEREQVFADLLNSLRPHMKGEERVLYPALASFRRSHGHAVTAVEQHHVARVLLAEMDDLPVEDERWEAKLSVFGGLIRQHMAVEENTVFDDARAVLTDEQEMDIYRRYQNEREKIRASA